MREAKETMSTETGREEKKESRSYLWLFFYYYPFMSHISNVIQLIADTFMIRLMGLIDLYFCRLCHFQQPLSSHIDHGT